MFDDRPVDVAPRRSSRLFEAANATVAAGQEVSRQGRRGMGTIGALILYSQAVIWGFGALMTALSAKSTGQAIFTIGLGGVIVIVLWKLGARGMAKAREL